DYGGGDARPARRVHNAAWPGRAGAGVTGPPPPPSARHATTGRGGRISAPGGRRCASLSSMSDQRDYVLTLTSAELARYRVMAGNARQEEAADWAAVGVVPGARIADGGCGPAVLSLT